ncbi:MAG: hypothetical protein K8T10_15170 [Candidatus Eremiobacteraeota bacterium]|nr:hypothetical protein [Candidatus Eremiobacteraeota bacterium]
MSLDKRMHFIRNMEALKKVESDFIEYEITSDADIAGEFAYGPYRLMLWDFSEKKDGEERKLCLRIEKKIPGRDEDPWKTAEKAAYYHGGGIEGELIAFASLFLRRRFKIGPQVRWNDKPFIKLGYKNQIDGQLVEGKSNLTDLTQWFKLVENLDGRFHQRYILAVRLYHKAIQMIEEEPDLAYLNLVSAIEVLCQKTDIEPISLFEVNPKLAKVLEKVEDLDLRREIEEAALKRQGFIRRRFVAFILKHVEDSFWKEEKRPEPCYGRIEPEKLEELLKRIYDQRSKTLHNGEPFPPSIFDAPVMGAEIHFSLGMSKGEKKWEPKDYIPNLIFFERLVNHVLKNFLEKNQNE